MIGCSPPPFIYRVIVESAAIGKVNPESNSFVVDHGYFFEMKSNREKGRKRERRVVSPVSFLLENNRREEEILEIRNSKHGSDNG